MRGPVSPADSTGLSSQGGLVGKPALLPAPPSRGPALQPRGRRRFCGDSKGRGRLSVYCLEGEGCQHSGCRALRSRWNGSEVVTAEINGLISVCGASPPPSEAARLAYYISSFRSPQAPAGWAGLPVVVGNVGEPPSGIVLFQRGRCAEGRLALSPETHQQVLSLTPVQEASPD